VDKQLFIEACREGGRRIEQALRALDLHFYPLLYRECRGSVGNADTARDLVQETFIRVWQRCASFRGESELIAWIRSILRHVVIDFLRARRPEDPLDDDEGELTPEVQHQLLRLAHEFLNTPEDLLAQAELEACYRSCRARFESEDPLHASVMRWVAEDGLSTEEVAALLERTPGATREFVSQCRKRARRYYAEWYALLAQTHPEMAQ
jgi:RNA polymerase sigma factor (sigma-70 family)